jgi:hypothetical protein
MNHEVSMGVECTVSAADYSVNRYTIRGTDPDMGKSYEIIGIDMVRVRDGQISDHWALQDAAAMRHQVGGSGGPRPDAA